MSAQHTPGPWYAETAFPSDNATVFAEEDNGLEWPAPIASCADFEQRRPVAEAQANARLIAAAPDLLMIARDHAKTIRFYMNEKGLDEEGKRLRAINLADVEEIIAKAEGRP